MLLRTALAFSTTVVFTLAGCASGEQPSDTSTGAAGSGGTTSAGGSTGATGGGTSTGGTDTGGGGTSTGGGGTGPGGAGPCGAPECTGDVEWVHRYGPTQGQQFPYGLGVDGTGQAIIAGGYNGTLDLNEFQLTTVGGIDMFWAKVNPQGVTVAAKSFGGAGNDLATGAAADRKGNSAYYGVFSGTLDFGNGPLQAQNFRMFLARLDPAGTSVWSKAFGDTVNASAQTAGFDPDGNVIYSAGYFGDIDFGLGPITGDGNHITLTKFGVAGDPIWSKQIATYMATAVTVDGGGGVLLGGGGDMANPPDLGCGGPGAFRVLGRLDQDGNCLWHKAVLNAAIDQLAADGPVFAVRARFNGTAQIGADSIVAANAKGFVARYDNDGTLLSFFATPAEVELDALAVDTHGGVVFKGRLTSGTADLDGHVLTGDSFLVRLGPDGEWLWGKGFQGDAAFPCFVGVAPLGPVFLFGRAEGPLDFGTGLLDGGVFPDEDIVLAKFKP